jgi:NAD(P)-dependent dehydrogenase (short-subunit alcohol dehydrogenase family)
VTGAGRGIGGAIAMVVASAGATIGLAAPAMLDQK